MTYYDNGTVGDWQVQIGPYGFQKKPWDPRNAVRFSKYISCILLGLKLKIYRLLILPFFVFSFKYQFPALKCTLILIFRGIVKSAS